MPFPVWVLPDSHPKSRTSVKKGIKRIMPENSFTVSESAVFGKLYKEPKYNHKHFCAFFPVVTSLALVCEQWVRNEGKYQVYTMMKRDIIPLVLLCILIIVFLIVPVSGGLTIANGTKITARTGTTSPVITITDSYIAEGGTITIDVLNLNGIVANNTFTNANVVVDDTSVNATWTGIVESNTLTLTSTNNATDVGETVIVTFTGAEGSAWRWDTGGERSADFIATRTDTSETAPFNFVIETTLGPGGLTVANGEKITTTNGATSMVITVTDAPLLQYDTITIDVWSLDAYVSGGVLTDANVVISDTADAATWTGALEWGTLTLTSNDGATAVGESVTVTFTGAGGTPWIPNTLGNQTVLLTANRMDNYATGDFNFIIETTPPPGGLTIADGAKITSMDGTTSPVITIVDSDIALDGTITIDVSSLNAYVVGGTLTDVNLVISDTAAAANWTGIVAGNTLTLTSTDGPTAVGENVTVTFSGAGGISWIPNTHGERSVSLTATRTDGLGWAPFNFVIETTPPPGFTVTANFSASPTSDIAPLTVTFTDRSLGSPTSWSWDFGDGGTSLSQNPAHIYTDVGTYTVSMTAINEYGPDTKTRWSYIHVLNGAIREANTSVAGLTITNCGGPQSVTIDSSILPAALIPNNSVLELQPPTDRGFNTITIYALNGVGFSRNGNLITGNPTGVHLVSEEIAPYPGFSNQIGTKSSFNYSVDLSSYPCNAILSTKIWEGVISEYETKLQQIASNNSAVPIGTAYTAKITKTNFSSAKSVKIHMSVDSGWNPSLSGGPGNMFIWRISDDGTQGQILPTDLNEDPLNNLDYYVAESPLGLSTFGLSSLTGNNNPFQMITLILSEIISPPGNLPSSDSNDISIPGAVVTQNTTSSTTKSPIPLDPGKTARIYANTQGVITQVTALQSTDGLATVNIGTGIVAKDAEGKPLSSITIKAIPSENLPNTSPGASFSFAGRAYELLPDGATFSPGITISFTAPTAQFGQDFLVKMYDSATDTWLDIPSSINPQTGIITAHISHFCCLALFTETVTPESASANTPLPTQLTPKVIAPAPTAMSTFMGMILWVADLIQKNIIIFAGLIILVIAIFLYGRKRRRDRLMYLF